MKKIISAFIATTLVFASTTMIFAQSNYTLTSNGSATISVDPDIANINIFITSSNASSSQATKDVNKKTDKVINALVDSGIKESDIITTGFNVYPNYDYNKSSPVLTGYEASHGLNITVRDINKVGEIIDIAVANGADGINNVSYGVSNEQEYYDQALTLAIKDAMRKGQVMANASGLGDAQVISIQENTTNTVYSDYQNNEDSLANKRTAVYANDVNISASVTITMGK